MNIRTITKADRTKIFGVFVLLGFFALIFQNCSSEVEFSSSKKSSKLNILGRLSINDDALYTNSIGVLLRLETNNEATAVVGNGPCPADLSAVQKDIAVEVDKIGSWELEANDGESKAHAILISKSDDVRACVEDSILLDRVPPSIEVLSGPQPYVKETAGVVDIQIKEETSGLDQVFCKHNEVDEFKTCELSNRVEGLKEGLQVVSLYAIDKAGNKSETAEHSWNVDLTAPSVLISKPTQNQLFTMSTVIVEFAANDASGSGVKSVSCALNGIALDKCESPVLLNQLADGNYKFEAVAVDNVGLASLAALVDFVVDSKPSGAFLITGVTSVLDQKLDAFLSHKQPPRVNWTASLGAQNFVASIYDATNTNLVCGPVQVVGAQLYADFNVDCVLSDNTSYVARVSAFRNGLETAASPLAFVADFTGPSIEIVRIDKIDEKKEATITFAVEDLGSGLATVTCYKKYKEDLRMDDCKGKTSIKYENLPFGQHEFYITAVDALGHNSQSVPAPFVLQNVVCDPFNLVDNKCVKGLKSNLYYASAAERAQGNTFLINKYNSVAKLIEGGIKSNVVIYFPFLDVRTRKFTEGFTTTENTFLTDENNQKLDEWFALEMETIIKLKDTDEEGAYQLMLISDDGSMLYVKDSADNNLRTLVNNDGTHPTRVGCSAVGDVLNLTKASRIPARITYYQGPRTQMGVSLFWRKVTQSNSAHSTYCGRQDGPSGYGFGLPENYQMILNEGFAPLGQGNFILAEEEKAP